MTPIYYIDRKSGEKKIEKIYKAQGFELLYSKGKLNRLLKKVLLPIISCWPFFSKIYGALQKLPSSASKIMPFIQSFEVDEQEFLDPAASFKSFNDFFIRRLKPEARPIDTNPLSAVIPADGRYYFYENIETCDGFLIKGKKFELERLLASPALASEFKGGGMVLARLCPSDYHRFHFPCSCLPGPTKCLNGYLYSVNPIAIKQNIRTYTQNRRTLCELQTDLFGKVLYLEIGATCVGSIRETYFPGIEQDKGAEKGYFEFGGSALVLLFKQGAIVFDDDLLEATKEGLEIRCLMGQRMGIKKT